MTHIVLNTKFKEIEKKRTNVSGLVATNVLNTKPKEDEGEIPNVKLKKMRAKYQMLVV